MNAPRRIAIWVWRAWPVLVMLLLIGLHLITLRRLPAHTVLINKLTGTFMQIIGGLIVLHAVDGNLGLFRDQSIASIVIGWFRDFPRFRRSVHASFVGSGGATTSGSVSMSVKRAATSIEERVAQVESQLAELRDLLHTREAAIHQRIDVVKAELLSSITSNQSEIKSLSVRFETATIGGFKQQAFGVFLVFYGALISILFPA